MRTRSSSGSVPSPTAIIKFRILKKLKKHWICFSVYLQIKNDEIERRGAEAGDDSWILFPFLDRSDNKRISRTCNHIVLEISRVREWTDFREKAVAIGENSAGDYLISKVENDTSGLLAEVIYWFHETRKVNKVANTILDIIEQWSFIKLLS